VVIPCNFLIASIADHSNGDYNLALHEGGAAAPPCFSGATQLDIHNGLLQLLNDFQQIRIKLEQIHKDFQHNLQQNDNWRPAQKLHVDILNDVRTMMRSEYLPDQKRVNAHLLYL
jgi:hypothetical protein